MRTTATPAETTSNVVVVVVVVVVIIFINFMQGTENYIPETDCVLEYTVVQLFCIYNLCYT